MNDRTRLFAQIVCFVLALGLLVIVAGRGRAVHPGGGMEGAIAVDHAAVPAAPQASSDVSDCTGTAGYWGLSTDPVTGARTMECRRYA